MTDMKKIIIIAALAVLAGCDVKDAKYRRKKELNYAANHEVMEINGHDYWVPVVGTVSGQSNGTTWQVVHMPDCRRCAEIRDSVIRKIISEELRNFGEEVE